MKRVLAGLALAGLALLAAGCGSSGSSGGQSASKVVLRLGFLENITHASALVGVKEGFFTKNLGSNVTLKLYPFSTGTEEATALLAGQLDAAYVGPNPAIKAWQQSSGSLIKVISGAASGGAELVVKKGITTAAQLKGQKLASPSLGNTQDVSMRYWLKNRGLTTTSTGGGDVPITPITPNSDAVLAFESGQIAGGWEPAPYDAEMIAAGGHALVDEASLWPNGQFVTTELVATQSFIAKNPTVISDLLKGQIEANSFIASNKSGRGGGSQCRAGGTERQEPQGGHPGGRIRAGHFHERPDRLVADHGRESRRVSRTAQPGEEPDRYLRSRPAEQAAGCWRAVAGQLVRVSNEQVTPPASLPGASALSRVDPADVGAPAGARADQAVRLTDVSKAYRTGRTELLALDQVSLTVDDGEFVCIIGASGCGKSTLLNLVAGLDQPTSGQVDTTGRKVGLMFQEPALFPWLTAGRNVELALQARGVPRAARRAQVAELLEAVRLGGFADKRPHELSGGMRQRVAMARALAQNADVLLMDEPFGALDAMTRDLLHDELERICTERTLTVLFVTHNVREAARLGDRVILLSSRPGRVIDEYTLPRTGHRRIDSPEVSEVAASLTDRLREEMGRHGD